MLATIATKTTGLKPELHEVIELAICYVDSGEDYYYRIKPEKPETYDSKVQEINGISAAVASGFPSKEDVAKQILTSHKKLIAIGHNIKFDYDMLLSTFGPDFVKELFDQTQFNDTMNMANALKIKLMTEGKPVPFKNLRLKTIADALGVKFTHKCSVIRECYKKILAYDI